ncbi:hypothetical protein F4775DRAFT_432192 [Biscogniauxia sp. FL1348]|nr:hypothetical protein F4775DRAFT_432192 [Biscogniauxia sp. FL1348]
MSSLRPKPIGQPRIFLCTNTKFSTQVLLWMRMCITGNESQPYPNLPFSLASWPSTRTGVRGRCSLGGFILRSTRATCMRYLPGSFPSSYRTRMLRTILTTFSLLGVFPFVLWVFFIHAEKCVWNCATGKGACFYAGFYLSLPFYYYKLATKKATFALASLHIGRYNNGGRPLTGNGIKRNIENLWDLHICPLRLQ